MLETAVSLCIQKWATDNNIPHPHTHPAVIQAYWHEQLSDQPPKIRKVML